MTVHVPTLARRSASAAGALALALAACSPAGEADPLSLARGGEVSFLHDGLPVSAATREEAEARCPGRYWIVGEVITG